MYYLKALLGSDAIKFTVYSLQIVSLRIWQKRLQGPIYLAESRAKPLHCQGRIGENCETWSPQRTVQRNQKGVTT